MSQRPTTNPQSNQPNPTNSFPNREASLKHQTPSCSFVPSVVNEVSSPATRDFPKRETATRDHHLTTLRARVKSIVVKNLLASPLLTRFYVDSVISNFPNSSAAKTLARNYQKIIEATMPSKSCTHIKVTGVACGSPALRGEQFCYFHQHAHRGVRRPPQSRLHPIALIEDEESIQASLMEVINALVRNTLDVKRAELIIRALNLAVRNARRVKFDINTDAKVKDVPQYAPPVEGVTTAVPSADETESELPAVAAKPYKPVDPRDPNFWERFEEGGRVLARESAEHKAAEQRATDATRLNAKAAAPASLSREATVVAAANVTTNASSSQAHASAATPDCTQRKPPMSVKAQGAKGRTTAARRTTGG
jgi:hypothetical protein